MLAGMENRTALVPLGAVMILLAAAWYAIAMPIYFGSFASSSNHAVVMPSPSETLVLDAR